MTAVNVDGATDQRAAPRKWGRIALIVSGVLVVALGVTAAIVVPQMLHTQRVEEYTALAEELRMANDEHAAVQTTLHAATALTYVMHGEAFSAATAVAVLGESKEPMIPASQAELLGAVGASAAEEIGPLDEHEVPEGGLHELLTLTYIETKVAQDQARAEAEEAGEDAPEATLPATLGELTVDQTIALLAAPVEPEPMTTVADEDVTDELIEGLRESIASVKEDIAGTRQAITAEEVRHEFLKETVASMVPVLHETVAAIDGYLATLEEQAAKATEEVAANTTQAAAHVRESAGSEDVAQLQGRIASYVVAGEASLVSHAEVVKAEEEAAEAKRLAEERAAKQRASKKSSSSGWASGGMCNYWSPMGGGMYMAPCN